MSRTQRNITRYKSSSPEEDSHAAKVKYYAINNRLKPQSFYQQTKEPQWKAMTKRQYDEVSIIDDRE